MTNDCQNFCCEPGLMMMAAVAAAIGNRLPFIFIADHL